MSDDFIDGIVCGSLITNDKELSMKESILLLLATIVVACSLVSAYSYLRVFSIESYKLRIKDKNKIVYEGWNFCSEISSAGIATKVEIKAEWFGPCSHHKPGKYISQNISVENL